MNQITTSTRRRPAATSRRRVGVARRQKLHLQIDNLKASPHFAPKTDETYMSLGPQWTPRFYSLPSAAVSSILFFSLNIGQNPKNTNSKMSLNDLDIQKTRNNVSLKTQKNILDGVLFLWFCLKNWFWGPDFLTYFTPWDPFQQTGHRGLICWHPTKWYYSMGQVDIIATWWDHNINFLEFLENLFNRGSGTLCQGGLIESTLWPRKMSYLTWPKINLWMFSPWKMPLF